MRFLMVNGNPFEHYKGKYYISFSWPVFAAKLADFFDAATLWSPLRELPDDVPSDLELFEPGRLKIVGSHYYNGFLGYYSSYPKHHRMLKRDAKRLIRDHDITMLRLSSPMAPLIVKYSRQLGKPFVFMVAGDIATASNMVLLNKGIKRTMLQSFVRFIKNREIRLSRHASLVYAYGDELAKQFGKSCSNVKIMRDATTSLKDIFLREDTCTDKNNIKLLRVGWLGPCKGYEYLFEAIRILRDRDLPVHLKIVGRDLDPQYSGQLRKKIQDLKVEEHIEFAGTLPYAEMARAYRESDIQVISSTSEGIPRVISEGAANGLPLVSTTAGGCASAVRDEVDGILVPPRDSAALAEGIERVIKDGELRRRIIQGGYEMARNYSSEAICDQIAGDMNEVLRNFSSRKSARGAWNEA